MNVVLIWLIFATKIATASISISQQQDVVLKSFSTNAGNSINNNNNNHFPLDLSDYSDSSTSTISRRGSSSTAESISVDQQQLQLQPLANLISDGTPRIPASFFPRFRSEVVHLPISDLPFGSIDRATSSLIRCDDQDWNNVSSVQCYNEGRCTNGTCYCTDGWIGPFCETCFGHVTKIGNMGIIYDGPLNYSRNSWCSWLLKPSIENKNKKFSNSSVSFLLSLRFNVMATEFCWDNIHIFDGDGIHSPKSAVFSGIRYDTGETRLLLRSGLAFILFSSDNAYNMSGFNISYRFINCHDGCVNDQLCFCQCHDNCSFVEKSNSTNCTLENCNKNGGQCVHSVCVCKTGFKGKFCNISSAEASWSLLDLEQTEADFRPKPVAAYAIIYFDKALWIFGGTSFEFDNNFGIFLYNFSSSSWHSVEQHGLHNELPQNRYDHCACIHKNKVLILGGVLPLFNVTNEMWSFSLSHHDASSIQGDDGHENKTSDFIASKWEWSKLFHHTASSHQLMSSPVLNVPLHVHGHSCHVTTDQESMLVFNGYNPHRGFLSLVQRYDIANNSWTILETFGARPPATYGHSTVLDPDQDVVYLYGGFGAISNMAGVLYDKLYVFDIKIRRWFVLSGSGQPSYLHSTALINGLLVTVGGNSHKESSESSFGSYFSDAALVFDIRCSKWTSLKALGKSNRSLNISLYGHRTVVHNRRLYLYGGFNGQFSNQIFELIPGDCSHGRDKDSCVELAASKGNTCSWIKNRCQPTWNVETLMKLSNNEQAVKNKFINGHNSPQQILSEKAFKKSRSSSSFVTLFQSRLSKLDRCQNREKSINDQELDCRSLVDCQSCTSSIHQRCVWCQQTQSCSVQCSDRNTAVSFSDCSQLRVNCSKFYSCNSCKYADKCVWDRRNKAENFRCVESANFEKLVDLAPSLWLTKEQTSGICFKPCRFLSNCDVCLRAGCVWCSNMKLCLDTNSYLSTFPYGQCLRYFNYAEQCSDSIDCHLYLSCDACRASSLGCGWCDDGSETGLGRCSTGGALGPTLTSHHHNPLQQRSFNANLGLSISKQSCKTNWFFDRCPACQCNGHAKCVSASTAQQKNQQSTTPISNRHLPSSSSVRPKTGGGNGRWLPSKIDVWTSAKNNKSSASIKRLSQDHDHGNQLWSHLIWQRFIYGANYPDQQQQQQLLLQCLPCQGKATGDNCEICQNGYYGNALNGGNCTACRCNGHASSCNPYSGKCYCSTKGVVGHKCDKCEVKYIGDPINSTCYYELFVDFVFTFSFTYEEDMFINRLNFISRPTKSDVDVALKIKCSSPHALESGKIDLNITNDYDLARGLSPRRLIKGLSCVDVQRTFSTEEFQFGTDLNTTIYMTLHDFKTPTIVTVSLAQTQTLDWMKFFITFALCFFILLITAFAIWKIKQRVDSYRRRQRLYIEMAQMANRPFATLQVDWSSLSCVDLSKMNAARLIACEPCHDYRAAVVTVAFRMPSGKGQQFFSTEESSSYSGQVAKGQSALALGTALCSFSPQNLNQLKDQCPGQSCFDDDKRHRRPKPLLGRLVPSIISNCWPF